MSKTRSMADVLSYAGSDAGVTVNLVTASVSGGHAEGDTIATYEIEVPADDPDEDPIPKLMSPLSSMLQGPCTMTG